jgi:CBS domain-containing protein
MLRDLAETPVRDIRSQEPIATFTADVAVSEAIRRMAEERSGAVLVVDSEGRLAGIFTERDVLLRSLEGNPAWQDRPVGEIMTPAPVTARDEDTLEETLGRMQRGHFRHLPVVDAGRPTGVVTIRDVVAYVAAHFPKQFVNLPPEPPRESSKVWGG